MEKNIKINVLLLEDNEVDAMAFERQVSKHDLPYAYQRANSIAAAKKLLGDTHFDIALLDHQLKDGTSMQLIETIEDTPTILITGNGNEDLVVKAMNAGAYDYIVKDTDGNYLTTLPSKVDNAIKRFRTEKELAAYRADLEKMVSLRTQELNETNAQLLNEITAHKKTVIDVIKTIAAIVEARDPYTAGHQMRVSKLATQIAKEMKLEEGKIESIRLASIVHDLGKINVPAEILNKPGKLSSYEFELIKTHPESGYQLISHINFEWPLAKIILQHHERMDGSGYPGGLKGEEILVESRILCVADVVEAMSSHRPYRPALGIEKALDQIDEGTGTFFDPQVVKACQNVFSGGFSFEK